MKKIIPLFWPTINQEEILKNLKKVFATRWIGQGPLVDKFEKKFSEKFGFRYCVMTNSGTAALHLAYIMAGIKKGDEVISTVLTCSATHHPLLWMGAKIKFADIEPDTLNMDPKDVNKKITKKTKAIIVTHLGGLTADISKINNLNIPIIEDACQALGAKRIGKADYTCLSFQAIKGLTTGDGGMLIAKNKKDYKRAKKLRWFAIDREQKIKQKWQAWNRRGITFDQAEPGYKYQPTDIDAAIGLANLKIFDKYQNYRKKLVKIYRNELKNVPGIKLLKEGDDANWLFMIKIIEENRDGFADYLLKKGIETNVAHIRNDIFTVFGGKRQYLPNMNKIETQYLCLPLNPKVSERDVKYICKIIKQYC